MRVMSAMDNWKTNYTYIFVHGLSGWGSYDKQDKHMKYWGMRTGDLLGYLNSQGFNCFSASVDPHGSAWDRACELYAQLTGGVVDYGKAHSERCKHARFGTDFSKNPLITEWNSEKKINFIGHSFGGATVRLMCELMANGSREEQEATDSEDISLLFTGGKADYINSITALASPHNGTSAYDVDPSERVSGVVEEILCTELEKINTPKRDGRAQEDYADFDMFIDNALELNNRIETLKNVYYFSYPCNSSIKGENGNYYPDKKLTDIMFIKTSILMGKLKEITPNGIEVDESWLMNDGLVNTISARAPFAAPQKEYEKTDIRRGVWNIMPIYQGDHMSLQGGLTKKNEVKDFYLKHLNLINSL